MGANLTISDLFTLLFFLVGIGVCIVLIMVLLKVNKILKNINGVLEDNSNSIDKTIKQLPEISYNINEITKETNNTIVTLKPELDSLLSNVNNISERADSITGAVGSTTDKLQETLYNVSRNIEDTTDNVRDSIVYTSDYFKHNSKTITKYIKYIKEIVQIVRKRILSR